MSRGGAAELQDAARPQGGPAAAPETPSPPGRAAPPLPSQATHLSGGGRASLAAPGSAGSPRGNAESPAGPGSSFTLSSSACLMDNTCEREGEGSPGRAGQLPKMAGSRSAGSLAVTAIPSASPNTQGLGVHVAVPLKNANTAWRGSTVS